MGRSSKKTETVNAEEQVAAIVQDEQTTTIVQDEQTEQGSNKPEDAPEAPSDKKENKDKIPPRVAEVMRLYPQYEELWITSRGFVHPVGAPKYLLKDATLYKNKFFNK